MVTVLPFIVITPACFGTSANSSTMSLSGSEPNVLSPGFRKWSPATVNQPLSASSTFSRSARKALSAASS